MNEVAISLFSGYLLDDEVICNFQLKFRCLVEQFGEVVATSAWTKPLNIEYSPRNVQIDIPSLNFTENENATITAGDEVVLTCNAQSNPEPEYEWLILDGMNGTSDILEHWVNQGKQSCLLIKFIINLCIDLYLTQIQN